MKTLRVLLAFLVAPMALAAAVENEHENELFEAPVPLMHESKPINSGGEISYPSPAIFDVDNDGKDELVLGEIFGTLTVFENENESKEGDPEWGQPRKVESSGEPIEMNNW